jgi:hypothetical protein
LLAPTSRPMISLPLICVFTSIAHPETAWDVISLCCPIDQRSCDVRKRALHLSERPEYPFVRYGEPNPRQRQGGIGQARKEIFGDWPLQISFVSCGSTPTAELSLRIPQINSAALSSGPPVSLDFKLHYSMQWRRLRPLAMCAVYWCAAAEEIYRSTFFWSTSDVPVSTKSG